MIAVNEIGWGSYGNYEGPFFMGKAPVKVFNASTPEMAVMVTAAAEGGHYDAWNGYDSCGWTSGAIQWCEHHQWSVSDMIGQVAEQHPELLTGVQAYATSVGAQFMLAQNGKWRFAFRDQRGVVDNEQKQMQLFYKTGNGNKGSWSPDGRLYAKGWAAAISSLWQDPDAQAVQRVFTYSRLGQFITPSAKAFLETRPMGPTADAVYAAYVSFAVNNPSWASNSLQRALSSSTMAFFSEEHLIHILKHLTFDPGVAIYPARYNAIRPVLEQLYGVQLPDLAGELQAWSVMTGLPTNVTTKQVQEALVSLSYDVGPTGADGKYGTATKAALFKFEQENGVPPANQDGMIDQYTYPVLVRALGAHGLAFPTA